MKFTISPSSTDATNRTIGVTAASRPSSDHGPSGEARATASSYADRRGGCPSARMEHSVHADRRTGQFRR
jgi:hypothetical protein